MKKFGLFLLAALLLTGCSKAPEVTPEAVVETTTISPTVDIGGTQVLRDTETLDLTNTYYDMDTLLSVAPELPDVQVVELGCTELFAQDLEQLQQAFPEAKLQYTLSLFGQNVPLDTTSLDMSGMSVQQSAELARVAGLLPQLEQINFVNSEGVCVFDLDTISQLDLVRLSAPQVKLTVNFELFGKKVTSEDERIEYYRAKIGNEGEPVLRKVLPYLQNCTYFLLDGCGLDNEVLSQLRADFPETKIVWRVWLCNPAYDSPGILNKYSFMTDTELIRTLNVRDFNCQVLMYCNETKYVDFGHNPFVSDFTFLGYMPQLEAAIIALTSCADLTPLANCPKLEYLEVFTTEVTDLSPLANCTELRHLNISNLKIDDLTPLYGLKNLERVRIILCDNITKEQIAELAEQLPDCQVLTKGWNPTDEGWRKDEYGNFIPRYLLLRQQMRYDYD